MKLEYILMAVTFAGLFLAALVSQQIKTRKGLHGADQLRLRNIVAKQLSGSGSYTIAYAYYSQTKLSIGRPVITTHSSHIVAFRPGELFVIPLQFSGKSIISHPGFLLNQENVGAIRLDKSSRITFYGTDGMERCTLCVSPGNTADGPFQPLNIQQKAEAEKFHAFLRQFTAEIRSTAFQHNCSSKAGTPMPRPDVCSQEMEWPQNT